MENTNENLTVKQVSVKYGLYVGLVFIIYGMILQLTGMVGDQILPMIQYLFLIGGIVLAHNAFKEANGNLLYGVGLGIGAMVTLVGAIISSVFSYIYTILVDDSIIQVILEAQEKGLIDQNMSDEEIEMIMQKVEPFIIPEIIFPIGIIVMVFFGFILSLIITLFTKKIDAEMESAGKMSSASNVSHPSENPPAEPTLSDDQEIPDGK